MPNTNEIYPDNTLFPLEQPIEEKYKYFLDKDKYMIMHSRERRIIDTCRCGKIGVGLIHLYTKYYVVSNNHFNNTQTIHTKTDCELVARVAFKEFISSLYEKSSGTLALS